MNSLLEVKQGKRESWDKEREFASEKFLIKVSVCKSLQALRNLKFEGNGKFIYQQCLLRQEVS